MRMSRCNLVVCLVIAAPVWAALAANAGDSQAGSGAVINERFIEVSGSDVLLRLWEQEVEGGLIAPFYSVALDGRTYSRSRQTDYLIKLRYSNFDPTVATPNVPAALTAGQDSELYLVQFVVPPLEPFRAEIRALGGTVLRFLSNHTHIVRMNAMSSDAVAGLPYVRWVGRFHTAYKLDEQILSTLATGAPESVENYSIEVFKRGGAEHDVVAARIVALGGTVRGTTRESFRMDVALTLAQLRQVIKMDEVHFIDPRGELEVDMDIVREIGGANFLETVEGFTGQGVRGEAADSGLQQAHVEFQGVNGPPLIHGPPVGIGSHGTAVYGVLFASGVRPQARGMLPGAEQGIFAEASNLRGIGNIPNRFQHTAQLVDPNGPYRAVFQTNSTGDGRTRQYTTISAAMDDLLFAHDILHCQSMSNANGTPDVRPQAWAKNIVGVGGVRHQNTINRADDVAAGSSGDAQDGRIKPDLIHFYDNVFTSWSTSPTGYGQFNGTSSATPITAGHFGLFFQMWHEGVWDGRGGLGSVFESRAKMATAKAMLINHAFRYPYNQGGLRRRRMGWGMADLRAVYDMADKTFIVDEEDLLTPFETNAYDLTVEPAEPELKVTLVYTDPMGPTSSTQHRINDLSLRVTSPSNVVYWGNNGLVGSNWSTPGGTSNTKDTVENVFIQNPEAGVWTVEVIGDEIIEDAHPETPNDLDADYALIVSGVVLSRCDPCDMNCDAEINALDIELFIDLLFNGADPCCGSRGDVGSSGDVNLDGSIDNADIEGFLNCLFP